MVDIDDGTPRFRAGPLSMVRAAHAAERDVFAALDPGGRDAPPGDGGWSAKDVLAHLSAWKRHQVGPLRAMRAGTDQPVLADETDEVNAVIHADRATWSWEQVRADAEEVSRALIAEVEAASAATLETDRISATIMGNGPEHTLAHLSGVAAETGLESRVTDLAATIARIIDDGGWPARAAADARYNLACYHALGGRLDDARPLLREALANQAELRAYALDDADLLALRDEIPSLLAG